MKLPPGNSEVKPFAEQPGLPRWLKLSAIAVLGLTIVVVVLQLVTGGQHGPGIHIN
jgi:hypothetical protein